MKFRVIDGGGEKTKVVRDPQFDQQLDADNNGVISQFHRFQQMSEKQQQVAMTRVDVAGYSKELAQAALRIYRTYGKLR